MGSRPLGHPPRGVLGGALLATEHVPSFESLRPGQQKLGAYAMHLLDRSGGPLFQVLFLCVALAFLMLIWAMLPSVAAGLAAPRNTDSLASRKRGFWLDHGFLLARLARSFVPFGLLGALTVGGVLRVICGWQEVNQPEVLHACFGRLALGRVQTRLPGLIGDLGLLQAGGFCSGVRR